MKGTATKERLLNLYDKGFVPNEKETERFLQFVNSKKPVVVRFRLTSLNGVEVLNKIALIEDRVEKSLNDEFFYDLNFKIYAFLALSFDNNWVFLNPDFKENPYVWRILADVQIPFEEGVETFNIGNLYITPTN